MLFVEYSALLILLKVKDSISSIEELNDVSFTKGAFPGDIFVLTQDDVFPADGSDLADGSDAVSGSNGDGFIYEGPIGGSDSDEWFQNYYKGNSWAAYYKNFGPFKGPDGEQGATGIPGTPGDPQELLSAIEVINDDDNPVLGGHLSYNDVSGIISYAPSVGNDWDMIPYLKPPG